MTSAALKRLILIPLLALTACQLLTSCGSSGYYFGQDKRNKMIVSVKDQRMLLVRDGKPVKTYKVSTSKFGLGDQPGSNRTPIGHLRVASKIGCNCPHGSVFKSRRRTGEILKPNAPGRDPIVTRILWLKGMEDRNKNAFRRTIYIHGTPEERRLGYPASFGCIRMSSKDVADLYNRVGHGADVFIIRGGIQTNRSSSQGSASTPSRRLFSRG
jgi:hypothetical protein